MKNIPGLRMRLQLKSLLGETPIAQAIYWDNCIHQDYCQEDFVALVAFRLWWRADNKLDHHFL
jgi:hypothetical protein